MLDRRSGAPGEEALRASEIRFSRFFNDTPFAIATLDRDGRIIRTNAPFGRIFGWQGSERPLDRVAMRELLSEGSRARFAEAVAAATQNQTEIEPVDAQLARAGDHAVRLYISGSEETADSPEQVNVYALDTTEQRKLEAQFAQGQKMQAVGQLAGGVAHDFNNVLTAIIGFADLLLLKHKPGDPSFSDLMSIKQSANRAAGLTRQLLAFSRRQTLRPQVLEVPTHIDDLTVLLKRLIGEQITLKVDHGAQIWPVKADLVQLEQVVVNLVVNARDAMPNGGAITVRTRNVGEAEAATLSYTGMPAADYVLIEVEDTGTGMAPDILEKIFEPFFRPRSWAREPGSLSTVYGIIKQTGGLSIPTRAGRGTVFRIFLPRHQPAEDELPVKAQAAVVKDLTGHERILLVEDEDNVRAFSARALRATGYEVFEADSGEEALAVLDDIGGEIDLMISDVVMPEMDGPALLLKVREKLPTLKVIRVRLCRGECPPGHRRRPQRRVPRQALFARPDQFQGQGRARQGRADGNSRLMPRAAGRRLAISTAASLRPDLCRLAAEQQAVEAAPAMRGHDDEVGAAGACRFDDGLRRRRIRHMDGAGGDVMLARAGGGGVEDGAAAGRVAVADRGQGVGGQAPADFAGVAGRGRRGDGDDGQRGAGIRREGHGAVQRHRRQRRAVGGGQQMREA